MQKEGEDYGYGEFIKTVDTVIIGRRTYDWVMSQVKEFPHADKRSFVITRTPRNTTGNTQFYSGDLKAMASVCSEMSGLKRELKCFQPGHLRRVWFSFITETSALPGAESFVQVWRPELG